MANTHKISVFSFAKFQAKFAALLGAAVGLLYAFGGLVIDVLVSVDLLSSVTFGTSGLSSGTALAFIAIVGMPLLFALVGLALGVLQAVLFRVYVKYFKAFDVDFWQ